MNMLFAKSCIKKYEGRKVSLVGYTGGIMEVAGIGIVAVDLAQMKIPEQVKVCYDHNENIDGLIGTGKARVLDGQLLIDGELLPDNEVADKVLNMLKEGVELECSIGAKIEETEYIEPRRQITVNGQVLEHELGFNLVIKSTLRECSVCLMGADNQTSISLKGKSMSNLLENEKTRVTQILEAVEGCPEHQTLAAKAIRENVSADEFRKTLLGEIRASRSQVPSIMRSQQAPTTDVLQAGFLLATNHEDVAVRAFGADAVLRAKQAGLTSVPEIAKQSLILSGERNVPTGSKNILKASFSTSSLTNILSGGLDKLLSDASAKIADNWRPFSRVRVLSNYRSHSVLRANVNAPLESVPASGEVTVGSLTETAFDNLRCDLYSKLVRVSLQSLINDDLSVFSDLPETLIRSAKKSLADNIYTTLLANANSFYSTGNANYIEGATTALSIDGLSQAITAMRKQVGPDKMPMDVTPVALIVPPDLETTARQVLNSQTVQRTGDNAPVGNPFFNSLTLVVDPRLSNTQFTNYSSVAWYLAAFDALNVGFVGSEAPEITTFDPSSESGTVGFGWRIEFSYGSAMGAPTSIVKSKGSA